MKLLLKLKNMCAIYDIKYCVFRINGEMPKMNLSLYYENNEVFSGPRYIIELKNIFVKLFEKKMLNLSENFHIQYQL